MACLTGPTSLYAAHFHMLAAHIIPHMHRRTSSLQRRRNLYFTLFMASSMLFQMSGSSASCTDDVANDFVFMIAHPYNSVWILPTSTVISIFAHPAVYLFLRRTGVFLLGIFRSIPS